MDNCFDVQQFLGFCNHSQTLSEAYSDTAEPLTTLTMKKEPFVSLVDEQATCQKMIEAFTTVPVLHDFDNKEEAIIDTDESDYVSA